MGDPVRIVYVSSAGYFGGAERYLELLLGSLDRDRFEPVLITFGAPGLDPLRAAAQRAEAGVVDLYWPSTFSAAGWRSMRAAVAERRPCIVHCNLPGPFDCRYGIPAVCARGAGALGVVTTEHLPMVPSFAKARLLRLLSARAIDRVITVSRDNASHLEVIHRVDPSRIRVIYNGIPDPGPAAAPRRDADAGAGPVRILMVGALERRKGHETMLEALRLLGARYRLDVAGAGPEEGRIRSLASGSELVDRVGLLGRVRDVPSLMAASEIIAVPSLLEATPYVILEAMAAARPVVASRIYGIPEIVEDGVTGLLVEPGDPSALAGALRRLGEDPDLALRIGRAGRAAFEERFTLQRSVCGTEAVYEELLRRGR
jgi:glycosyltransferase involved in cell wall biosynthesis